MQLCGKKESIRGCFNGICSPRCLHRLLIYEIFRFPGVPERSLLLLIWKLLLLQEQDLSPEVVDRKADDGGSLYGFESLRPDQNQLIETEQLRRVFILGSISSRPFRSFPGERAFDDPDLNLTWIGSQGMYASGAGPWR